MLFESSRPVIGSEFSDREDELKKLLGTVTALKKGSTRYLAVLGLRKLGKTSLLYEFIRCAESTTLSCFIVDCWHKRPSPKVFFREFLAQAVDAYIRSAQPECVSRSLKAGLLSQTALLTCLADLRRVGVGSIERACEVLLELERENMSDTVLEEVIDLPERIAQETQTHCVVLIDEFQELQHLNTFRSIKENAGDIFALLRARWQQHRRVNYVLSGSRTTAMRDILTRERAPFFQHFDIMELSPFDEAQALELLRSRSADEGNPIPAEVAARTVDTIGACPFYLQVVGAELCGLEKIDLDGLKIILQRLLFEESGRLHLYFRDLVGRVVGKSASVERVLVEIATKPAKLSVLARRLGIAPGTLKSWIARCSELIEVDAGTYRIADPSLALWLRMKSPERAVLPAVVLGDEAEQQVARAMAIAGFELVYQSRASRGAFDLLAVQGSTQVGVQVKKAHLPFYLPKSELALMQHWAKRLGWLPLLALVDDDEVRFYRVASLRTSAKHRRFDARSPVVENLLDLCSPDASVGRHT